jgi:hypothetical protein
MVDCGNRFFRNCHGQVVKDGGAMVFYFIVAQNVKFLTFRHPQ